VVCVLFVFFSAKRGRSFLVIGALSRSEDWFMLVPTSIDQLHLYLARCSSPEYFLSTNRIACSLPAVHCFLLLLADL